MGGQGGRLYRGGAGHGAEGIAQQGGRQHLGIQVETWGHPARRVQGARPPLGTRSVVVSALYAVHRRVSKPYPAGSQSARLEHAGLRGKRVGPQTLGASPFQGQRGNKLLQNGDISKHIVTGKKREKRVKGPDVKYNMNGR